MNHIGWIISAVFLFFIGMIVIDLSYAKKIHTLNEEVQELELKLRACREWNNVFLNEVYNK